MHLAAAMPANPADDHPASVSLLIPVWNEASSIARLVERVEEALARVTDCFEILIIDDGGRDGAAAAVRAISVRRPRVRLVRHEPNHGYGAALRSGFAAATCQLVAFTDAACQFDVSQLDRFAILSRAYDIVCGHRHDCEDRPMRAVYFHVFNQLLQALRETELRDVERGLKLFHRESLLNLTPIVIGNVANLAKSPPSHQQAS